ncbi:MAG: tetratricopeptide repeat protein [Planctomycetota bacterium]
MNSPSRPRNEISKAPCDEPFEIILEEDVIPRGTFDIKSMRPSPVEARPLDGHSESDFSERSWRHGVGSLARFLVGAAAIVGFLLLAIHVYSERAAQLVIPENGDNKNAAASLADSDVEPPPIRIVEEPQLPNRKVEAPDLPPLEHETELALAIGESSQEADLAESDVMVDSAEAAFEQVLANRRADDEPMESIESATDEELAAGLWHVGDTLPDPKAPLVTRSAEIEALDPVSEMPTEAASVPQPSPEPPLTETLLAEARAAEAAGELASARTAYERVLEEDPSSVEATYRLGLLDQRAGDLTSAARRYRQAIDLDPAHAPSWNNLSVLQWKTGERTQARLSVSEAIELEPELADAWSNRGWMAYESGVFDSARRDLGKALELQPGLPEAHYNLASLELASGRLDEAEPHIAALEMLTAPSWQAAASELQGRIAWHRNERESASQHYESALALEPSRKSSLAALARLRLEVGDTEGAWTRSTELLAAAPDWAESHRTRASVLMGLEDFESARASFQRVVELEPGSAPDLFHLALAAELAGVMPEALRRYEEVLEVDARHTPTLVNLGLFYLKADRPEDALGYFERAIEIESDNEFALVNRGFTLRELGRSADARRDFESALAVKRARGQSDPELESILESFGATSEERR